MDDHVHSNEFCFAQVAFQMIWLIRKIILLFGSETSPYQLAAGVAFGLMLGLTPMGNLVWPSLLILTLILRVNLSMTLVFSLFSCVIYYPLYPVIISIGESVLKMEFLKGVFEFFNNTPILAISGFNFRSVIGGLLTGLVLGMVTFPINVKLINLYRSKVLKWLEKFWLIRVLKGSKLYDWYSRIF